MQLLNVNEILSHVKLGALNSLCLCYRFNWAVLKLGLVILEKLAKAGYTISQIHPTPSRCASQQSYAPEAHESSLTYNR